MTNITFTDPRTGETIRKSYKAVKTAAVLGYGYNPDNGEYDIPTVTFYKDRAAAEKSIPGRVNPDCQVLPL